MKTAVPSSPAVYRVRRLARACLIYGLLLGGSLVFLLPFVWMVSTSVKVDREMMTERIHLMPQQPVPALRSPWVAMPAAEPPRQAHPEGLAVTAALLATRPAAWPDSVRRGLRDGADNPADAARRERALAAALWSRLARTLPPGSETWTRGRLRAALDVRLTPDVVAETRQRLVRALSFGVVRVRSLDLVEAEVGGRTGAPPWQVSGPAPARFLEAATNGPATLAYDFRGLHAGRVSLDGRFVLPFPVDRLQRLQLGFEPDDSWHRVDVEIEMGGALWRAKRPEFLSNYLPGIWTFRPYGPDDASTRIHDWNPLMKVARGPQYEQAPDAVRIRLVMRQSGTLDAWWAKCRRNYVSALNDIPFWRYAATSLFLVVLCVAGTLAASSLVAYAFARLQWPGRDLVFGLMLATMMIPGQVTMIPHFLIIRSLGWYNTLTPLWVGSLFGNAFSIFLLRQFMKGIPRDLEDAARIDGCNAWQVYWNVMLPLVRPTLACIAVFTFMGVWNDFMGPLIFLTDQRLYPLSLGLYALNVQAGGSSGMLMASACLMTLPVIVLFFFAQKYFIQGITLTGMKG